jgi:ATP-dependent RNA helicase DeaD
MSDPSGSGQTAPQPNVPAEGRQQLISALEGAIDSKREPTPAADREPELITPADLAAAGEPELLTPESVAGLAGDPAAAPPEAGDAPLGEGEPGRRRRRRRRRRGGRGRGADGAGPADGAGDGAGPEDGDEGDEGEPDAGAQAATAVETSLFRKQPAKPPVEAGAPAAVDAAAIAPVGEARPALPPKGLPSRTVPPADLTAQQPMPVPRPEPRRDQQPRGDQQSRGDQQPRGDQGMGPRPDQMRRDDRRDPRQGAPQGNGPRQPRPRLDGQQRPVPSVLDRLCTFSKGLLELCDPSTPSWAQPRISELLAEAGCVPTPSTGAPHPDFHQVVGEEAVPGVLPGTISVVVSPGFSLRGDRGDLFALRKAQVKVAPGKLVEPTPEPVAAPVQAPIAAAAPAAPVAAVVQVVDVPAASEPVSIAAPAAVIAPVVAAPVVAAVVATEPVPADAPAPAATAEAPTEEPRPKAQPSAPTPSGDARNQARGDRGERDRRPRGDRGSDRRGDRRQDRLPAAQADPADAPRIDPAHAAEASTLVHHTPEPARGREPLRVHGREDANDAPRLPLAMQPPDELAGRPKSEGFAKLGLNEQILADLAAIGFQQPSPIQEEAIPHVLAGKDMIGQAQTGTGKTAAFGLPALQMLYAAPAQDGEQQKPVALVLTPTRELAKQVHGEIVRFGGQSGARAAIIYGGVDMDQQFRQLQRGPHIIVGTPGRIIDHMKRRTLDLSHLRLAILDEADQMLDIGFWPDVNWIIGHTPPGRQLLMFSATMPKPVQELADKHMHDPVHIRIAPKHVTVEQVDQKYIAVPHDRKNSLLAHFIETYDPPQLVVFCRTKHQTDRVAEVLKRKNMSAGAIHGDLPQAKRERTLAGFRAGEIQCLVATNVAARGLDIPTVSHVVNYDVPEMPEEYVHRIGRTARNGARGVARTFITPEDGQFLLEIEKHIGLLLEEEVVPGFELPPPVAIKRTIAEAPVGGTPRLLKPLLKGIKLGRLRR